MESLPGINFLLLNSETLALFAGIEQLNVQQNFCRRVAKHYGYSNNNKNDDNNHKNVP